MAAGANSPTSAGRPAESGKFRPPLLPSAILVLAFAAAVLAPFISAHDPLSVDLAHPMLPPYWMDGNLAYPLGTDALGRDILSRLLLGARITLLMSFSATLVAASLGTAIGLVSGYFKGALDAVVMRITDGFLALPIVLVALVLTVVFGASFVLVISIMALFFWPQVARLVRGEVLELREREYVALAKVAGSSSGRILVRHLLPNVLNTVVVTLSLQMSQAILLESSLSFLGAGVPPPLPSWGSMVSDGRQYIDTAWWIAVIPGLAIVTLVVALSFLGDWLRKALDPTLRQL